VQKLATKNVSDNTCFDLPPPVSKTWWPCPSEGSTLSSWATGGYAGLPSGKQGALS